MNTRKILVGTVAGALLGLTAPQATSAQATTPPPPAPYVMVNWGAIHLTPGQAVVLNLALGDEGGEMKLPVQVELEDKNGNVVYRNTFTIATGHTISLVVGPEIRTGPDIRTVIDADIYAIIGPEVRTIIPCLKVAWPPGPTQPILDQLTPTLEVLDALTGRVEAFGNHPHLTIAGATE
jgi:hypothetical protein